MDRIGWGGGGRRCVVYFGFFSFSCDVLCACALWFDGSVYILVAFTTGCQIWE
jgi:hypothetical protein